MHFSGSAMVCSVYRTESCTESVCFYNNMYSKAFPNFVLIFVHIVLLICSKQPSSIPPDVLVGMPSSWSFIGSESES